MSEKISLFRHTEPVICLKLQRVTENTMWLPSSQEQVAQKLYGIYKTIETVANKTQNWTKQESMMIRFCQQL
jgi:phage-related minor tail protein